MTQPLDRAFYARHPALVARELLGSHLVHETPEATMRVRVVETEAYLGPEDPGSHATRGRDTQAGTLWEKPGQAYVYVCYGIHQMLNVVAHEPDEVGALLFRAGEPLDGVDRLRDNRDDTEPIATGPGRLAEALGVTRKTHDGQDLTTGLLRLEPGTAPDDVEVTGRIGLSEGSAQLLRFVDPDSDAASEHPNR
jgi:DNA-3-methyladenine glycosylase